MTTLKFDNHKRLCHNKTSPISINYVQDVYLEAMAEIGNFVFFSQASLIF